MSGQPSPSWRQIVITVTLVFVIAATGCAVAFALWWRDISAPQVVVLGTGNRLSILVADGPARLVLATGDEPIAYGNALARFQPLFARRVDLLLVAGADRSLLVPVAAHEDRHTRTTIALAPLLASPEAQAIGPIPSFHGPRRVQLGPNIDVTVETAHPYGTQPTDAFPAWRATIERGATRVVVLSDGGAAELFPPGPPAAAVVVSGANPAAAWDWSPAVALVANSEAISGPELRETFADTARAPLWGVLVAPGEALRLRFIDDGLAMPSEPAQRLGIWP